MADIMAVIGPPILITACGNPRSPWMNADALGPLVAQRLQGRQPGPAQKVQGPENGGEVPCRVEIVNLGMRPAALLDHLPGRQALGVVDAVTGAGFAVGQVVEVDWFDPRRPQLVHEDVLSTHGLSLGAQLELARQLGMLPARVRLFGLAVMGGRVPASGGRASDSTNELPEACSGKGLDAIQPAQIEELVRRIERWCEAELGRIKRAERRGQGRTG